MDQDTAEEQRIGEGLQELYDLTSYIQGGAARGSNSHLPEPGERYIFEVRAQSKFISSDFIGESGSEKLIEGLVIRLDGTPTPSTPRGFTSAYLIFDEKGHRRPPNVLVRGEQYILYVYYPFSYLDSMERLLAADAPKYCWVGNFSSTQTNIHADVHVSLPG